MLTYRERRLMPPSQLVNAGLDGVIASREGRYGSTVLGWGLTQRERAKAHRCFALVFLVHASRRALCEVCHIYSLRSVGLTSKIKLSEGNPSPD